MFKATCVLQQLSLEIRVMVAVVGTLRVQDATYFGQTTFGLEAKEDLNFLSHPTSNIAKYACMQMAGS